MAKLTILRGISGSGKSTWARQQNATVVSRDALRLTFFPNFTVEEYYQSPVLRDMEDTVTRIQDATIGALLKAGKDVIVDNTNIEWKYVKALAKIGYRYGAEVEVKVFDVPTITAVVRDHGRAQRGGRSVGEAVIRKQAERFDKNRSMTLDPVPAVKPYNGTPGKQKAFLVDIDGTLAHMRDYRGPFDWKKVGLDDVDEKISSIVRFIEHGAYVLDDRHNVIIMSGRDESCRAETEDWLAKHDIVYGNLYMRPAGDMRPDNVVKAELFDKHIRDWFDVQFVLDDRDQVVEMWRAMGLTCLQVAEGNF